MSGVSQHRVSRAEADMRLDRWFKARFPDLPHGRLSKLVRTGQVRVDGHRVKTSTRLAEGQTVRVPPLGGGPVQPPRAQDARPSDEERAYARSLVLHEDASVIVLNKPPGLASQGGKGVTRHVDGLARALANGGEAPRLVHRLDRDTSGVLVLGRTAPAARSLSAAFRSKTALKLYEAVLVGVPDPRAGKIDAPMVKTSHGRNLIAEDEADEDAKRSVTAYEVVDQAGKRACRVVFRPLTGRTHQLRVHAKLLGTPILGDGKYGGRAAFLPAEEIEGRLHLHARRLRLPHPDGGVLDVTAPYPEHMLKTYDYLGLDPAGRLPEPEA